MKMSNFSDTTTNQHVTIATLLAESTHQLSELSDTPQLDAQVLLGHVLNKSRTALLTHPEFLVDEEQQLAFIDLLALRLQKQPIAYLTGEKSFWTLDLEVNEDVLVPRPETELLVEKALSCLSSKKAKVADLGTGSGAIALALGKERPGWDVYAVDKSTEALTIAQKNAEKNGITNISFLVGDWCQALGQKNFDMIVSNPPYIDARSPYLKSDGVVYEPTTALVADDCGYQDLYRIIDEASEYLMPKGFLLLEHGFEQQESLLSRLEQLDYASVSGFSDLNGNPRVVVAQKP